MRLFAAVDLPTAVKHQLDALRAPVPGARWVGHEQMHLTLFFIGETGRLPDIKAALDTVRAAPFDLLLTGVGRFPPGSRKPPRVLWAGIAPQPALLTLQAQVAAALTALGFPAEDRAYSPHLTLARLKAERPLPEADRFLAAHAAFRAGPVRVESFVLYASDLTPQGARYTPQAVYPLRG
jgi:2'-5' RNA ligase